MLDRFLNEDTTAMRLARTAVQGVAAALAVFAPTAVGWLDMGPEAASFATACVMAVLSPLMSLLRGSDTIGEEEGC